jgi:hypothetical protein
MAKTIHRQTPVFGYIKATWSNPSSRILMKQRENRAYFIMNSSRYFYPDIWGIEGGIGGIYLTRVEMSVDTREHSWRSFLSQQLIQATELSAPAVLTQNKGSYHGISNHPPFSPYCQQYYNVQREIQKFALGTPRLCYRRISMEAIARPVLLQIEYPSKERKVQFQNR